MGRVEDFSSCSHPPLAAVLSGERFIEGRELRAADGRRGLLSTTLRSSRLWGMRLASAATCACQAVWTLRADGCGLPAG